MNACIRLILLSILVCTVNTSGATTPAVLTLGIHAQDPTHLQDAASAGYKAIRLWDTETSWRDIQPNKGEWKLDYINEYVTEAEAAGLKVIWSIGNTPQWASARPDEICPYGLGCGAEPSDINDWRNYVRTIATKFKGRIECYEVWNEVNFPNDPLFEPGDGGTPNGFFTGLVDDMVNLTRVAYEEIKRADPNACVLSPSFHNDGNWSLKFDKFLAAGGGKYIDVVSQHFYVDPEPENAVVFIREEKAVLAKYGLSKLPMWDTEVGNVFPDEAAIRPTLTIEDVVYSLVLRNYLIHASEGVSRVYWYGWDDEVWGLSDKATQFDFGSAAASAAIHLLDQLQTINCQSKGKLWQCKVLAGGRKFKVVWVSGVNARSQRVVLTGNATRWGNIPRSFKAGQSINIDARPVIINGW